MNGLMAILGEPGRGSARQQLLQRTSPALPPRSSQGGASQVALLVFVVGLPALLVVVAIGTLVMFRSRLAQSPPPAITPALPSFTPPVAPPTAAPTSDGLDEAQARAVVEEWLRVKANVFAPPFDQAQLDAVVSAGPLWTDITRDGGSISWLRDNNRYYTYPRIEVTAVTAFTPSPERPSLIATVSEDQILHGPDGNQAKSSNDRYLYTFAKEDGRWKIYDYKKL